MIELNYPGGAVSSFVLSESVCSQLGRVGELAQPVQQLFYQGEGFLELMNQPLVAIVGSRKVSPYGRSVTIRLSSELARAGVVIVSGLALGVDSIAHQAVLDAGGKTIAVLPSGLDRVYPASHQVLAQRIVAQGGALVTEYPATGELPQKYQFIARNRIIAALSRGVLVTEAAQKSGSLHTADFALELGLEVFAVPGNITSPNSMGTNTLIKNGATPVTIAQDILETLGVSPVASAAKYQPANQAEAVILSLLKQDEALPSDLLEASQLDSALFNQTITMLEINGVIYMSGASQWSLR